MQRRNRCFPLFDANELNNKMWNKIIQVLPRDIENPFILSSLYRLHVLTYHLFWPLNLFLQYCVNFGHKVSQLNASTSVLYDLISTNNYCKLIFILLREDTHLYLAPKAINKNNVVISGVFLSDFFLLQLVSILSIFCVHIDWQRSKQKCAYQ